MGHLIKHSKDRTSLFLPIYNVKKIEDQIGAGHAHKHDTRFAHNNRSYYSQDSVSATLADEAKKHHIRPHLVKEKQKEALIMAEYRKEEARREQEKVKSEERRSKMQQIKNELQIGEIEGFDDTMLDLKIQEKIMEDLERQKKENKLGKAGVTYPKSQQLVSQSQSRVPGYEHHQQPHDMHHIRHQDPHAQSMYSGDIHSQNMPQQGMGQRRDQQGMGQQGVVQQGVIQQCVDQQGIGQGMGHQDMGQNVSQQRMYQQGMGQQGGYLQDASQQNTYSPPQDINSQGMFYQGAHQQGRPQQDMHSQSIYQQQEWPQHGMYPQQIHHSPEMFQQQMPQHDVHPQGLQPQGMNNSNMPQPDQRNIPQNYQSQQYNLSPNNSNWQGENSSYPMERQNSTEFNQIRRAEINVPNNTSEPYRQMEVSHNIPRLEVGDAIQSGSNLISYGTIKWIGKFSGFSEKIAGVEMVKKLCTTV